MQLAVHVHCNIHKTDKVTKYSLSYIQVNLRNVKDILIRQQCAGQHFNPPPRWL